MMGSDARFLFDNIGNPLSAEEKRTITPKAILTLDEDPDGDYAGIRRIHLLE